MQCSGRAVWTLLQASPSSVAAVRSVAEVAGPLSCKRNPLKFQCLTRGKGEWQCGAELLIDEQARQALNSMWPSAPCWQRDFEAHVMVGRRPVSPVLQHTYETIEKQRVKMVSFDPKVVKVIAYDLTSRSASVELEQSLEALGDR